MKELVDLEDLHIVLINADWRVLTFAGVCWRMLAGEGAGGLRGPAYRRH